MTITSNDIAAKMEQLSRSARRRGLKFGLSKSCVEHLLKQTHCAYSGEEFNKTVGSKDAASVERINPKRGYVRGNVVAVKSRYNQVLGDMTPEERADRLTQWSEKVSNAQSRMDKLKLQLDALDSEIQLQEAALKNLREKRKEKVKERNAACVTFKGAEENLGDLRKAIAGAEKYEGLTFGQRVKMWFKGEL